LAEIGSADAGGEIEAWRGGGRSRDL